jgi:hypothetical protein
MHEIKKYAELIRYDKIYNNMKIKSKYVRLESE